MVALSRSPADLESLAIAEIRGRSSTRRLAARETRSRPIVEAFGRWLRAQCACISRKSRIGEKLIATAEMNGIGPFAYTKATLAALAIGHLQSRLDDLMPWAFKPPSS